ncbi:chaplin [Kitasatospora paranensis]|uniref:Chaplin family protein n=1 Tax=Kitasatospora paranensis TaxID=258053 RepID=A0ABW2G672_9ACTN
MRQVAKRGILTAVATGSVLASASGYAYAAGSEAQGGAANSPGVGSGNSVQVPVDIPVNACGNTVNVIGLLNPAYGNQCGNVSTGHHGGSAAGGSGQTAPGGGAAGVPGGAGGDHQAGGHEGGTRGGGSSASGGSHGSPGVGSGNTASVPVHAPVNACGNTLDVVGLANPAFGNSCGNHSVAHPPTTPPEHCGCSETPPVPPTTGEQTPPPPTGTGRTGDSVGQAPAVPVVQAARLASTGASDIGGLAAAGAALLLGGGVLYRRSRAGAR